MVTFLAEKLKWPSLSGTNIPPTLNSKNFAAKYTPGWSGGMSRTASLHYTWLVAYRLLMSNWAVIHYLKTKKVFLKIAWGLVGKH